MVQLIAQCLALLAAAALLRMLLARLGVRLPGPQVIAMGILLFLTFIAVWQFRETWKGLDAQREKYAGTDRGAAHGTCAAVGVDIHFLQFVGKNVPVRERYYMETQGNLVGQGDLCIRFLLLPRLAVARPEQARYLVIWNPDSPKTLNQARARGGQVLTHDRDHHVVRMP